MKKVWMLILAAAPMILLVSCGKKDPTSADPEAQPSTLAPVTQSQDSGEKDTDKTEPAESGNGPAEEARIPGKLYFFNTDKNPNGKPLLSGLRLSGNRIGSSEFNAKEAAVEGIRCIFELNEWVEFYPETDIKDGLQVWVLKHQEDRKDYEKAEFSELTPGYVHSFDLEAADAGEQWGSFYLNPDDAEEGYYDIVFTRNGKAGAVLITRFYQEKDLDNKSDAELEQIMKGLETQ